MSTDDTTGPGVPSPTSPESPTLTGASAPPAAAVERRIAASIEHWQRKLIDLSKRNRALNFKMSRVSTIAIVDEQPAEVFRQLCVHNGAMRFKPTPAPEARGTIFPEGSDRPDMPEGERHRRLTEQAEAAATPIDEEDGEIPSLDFAPYAAGDLDARHTDDVLQTRSTPEQLDKSLRRIDEQARAVIDEQGVNALFLALGMLQYTESADSDEPFKAPLLLVPVELTRKSARAGYVLRATDDDPLVNPALVEYLQRGFGVVFPALPDAGMMPDDYDLQTWFAAAAEAIATRPGWAVKTEIYLSLFSFQKFVMYKDLEAHTAALMGHRLIRQLITRAGTLLGGLPNEIRAMDLDREFPPEATAQVVDADASQLRALAAVARNYDLVLHGPPGTGKSQTITNLIAQALAAGKSVLFVAEKMAALRVVHSRLVGAGLGEFCLELHSTKANKRAVMQELAASLDASLQPVAAPTSSTQRLPQVRASLTEYATAVHTPHGTLGISPYRAYGALGAVLHAPRLQYTGPVETVTPGQLDETVRALTDLAVAATGIGNPNTHPWREASRTFYSEDDLHTIHALADDLGRRLADIRRHAEAVEAAFRLPTIRTCADVAAATAVATVLARSPGAPLTVLESEAWNAPPPEAIALVARGRAIMRLKARASQQLRPEALGQDHADDIAYVEQKSQGVLRVLAILDGRYRAIKRRWQAYRLPSYHGTLLAQAEEMKAIDQLRREQHALSAQDVVARQLFGGLWQGEESSWDVLERYITWVVEFRGLCIRHGLSGRTMEVASRPSPDVSAVHALQASVESLLPVLASLRAALAWPEGYLAAAPFEAIAARANALAANVGLGPRWAAFEAARQTAAAGLGAELLPSALAGEVPFSDLAPAFLRAFYQRWLSEVVQARPPLRAFHTLTHEERLAEFQALDARMLLENRAAVVSTLRDMVQQRLQAPDAAAALPFLRREMARQRNLSPLRRTMRHAEAAIRAIKPCFMMSPLSVAQLLDGAAPSFDLVIFDEASQLPAEDAVGATIRGRQLVVVGDPKQLPPTNFFTVMSGQVTAPLGEDGTPLFEDTESILEEFIGAGLPQSRLKWHYRSTHESLITFSNVSFYDADLYTFPSVETGMDANGLQFEYVDDGVYEGKGLNLVEARRVADAVVRHAKRHPDQSLGVGTFNLRQQLAIQDELEQRRRQDPSLEPLFARKEEGAFFVKNLENIQGDERDVIFISVTYAKGLDGRLRYNFGPLNGENGWRRLNVLTTRARQRMRVFSSIKGEEISAAATTAAGAKLLREFLLYAEHGRFESVMVSAATDTESPFERDVFTELSRRGLTVVPQVGCAGYRVDFGIIDEVTPGRFVCGIECDGVAYHASETARDRDRLRQQVLEARGWTIHRVWSTDWFKDRQGQVERLIGLIDQSRARAREEAEAERAAQVRAAAEAAAEAAAVVAGASAAAPGPAYERPIAPPYRLTPGEGCYEGAELLSAPAGQLLEAVAAVVEAEAPLHLTDVAARVAGMWRVRVGARILARITETCRVAERDGRLTLRDPFVWRADGKCVVRSRTGTRIPAERIAPEEYVEAVLMVLGSGHGFARGELINEVRALLGFSRTGPQLEAAIGAAVEQLLAHGTLGEGSGGLRLRC